MFIKPFDEKELAGIVFIEGEAHGTFTDVVVGSSKNSGQLMITLFATVWDMNENEIKIRDYILLNDQSRWKLVQLFKALGKIDKIKDGLHSEGLVELIKDSSFKCEIHLVEDKNDKSKKFMRIKRYIEQAANDVENNPFDKDVPF